MDHKIARYLQLKADNCTSWNMSFFCGTFRLLCLEIVKI